MDNKATAFVSENTNSTPRARHIDVKHRWVSQLIEEGFLKMLFVQSADNLLDECTKNVSPEVHDAHKPHCLAPRESHKLAWTMKRQQRIKVMKSSMQGRVLEMSPRNSSVPNRNSSVVHLADVIVPNQSHRNLILPFGRPF